MFICTCMPPLSHPPIYTGFIFIYRHKKQLVHVYL